MRHAFGDFGKMVTPLQWHDYSQIWKDSDILQHLCLLQQQEQQQQQYNQQQ